MKGLLEKAELAAIEAEERVSKSKNSEIIQQMARKIISNIQVFLSPTTKDKDEVASNIRTDIKELQKLDKGYASDLRAIFKRLQKQSS